jgi:hypothetical protein
VEGAGLLVPAPFLDPAQQLVRSFGSQSSQVEVATLKDRELINQQFCFPEGAHGRAPAPEVWILLNPHS